MTALSIRDLAKSFGGVNALGPVTFTVEECERRAVIGPNGAGKTTLFHALSGTILPSSGTIFLFGREITRLPPYERARLGLARTFQITNLFPCLSVLENILLAVQGSRREGFVLFRPMTAHRHLFERAERLLDESGLAGSAGRIVKHLSYGEQRQVELILALAGSPRLLLLDEPTAGLSPAETAQVFTIIQSLPRDMTILLIEHDMDFAFKLADRITVLHQGRLIAEGDRKSISTNSQVNEIYLGAE